MNVTAPDGSLVTDVPDGTTKAQFLAKWNVGKGPQSSALGAFGRGAERGAIPAAGGFAGAGAGAEAGALAGALIPGLGETGLGEAGGAVVGGLAGAFGGGALAEKAQNYIGSKVPDIIKRAFGQDAPQQAADVKQHPYASFAGELAPNLAAMRPGAIAKAAEGAPRIVKALTHPITQRAVPAATFGGIEAGEEYADKGKIDPGKVAIAAGVGAVSNKPTRVGKALIGTGSKAAEAIERAFGIHAPVIEAHRGTAEGAAAEKGQKAAEAVDASEAAARGAKPATETAAGAVKKATDIPQPEPEKPIRAYHGTDRDFAQYDTGKGGKFGARDAKGVTFFTDDPAIAGQYANFAAAVNKPEDLAVAKRSAELQDEGEDTRQPNVRPVNLTFENPKEVDWKGEPYSQTKFSQEIDKAKNEGHDAVVFKNVDDDVSGQKKASTVYASFNPNEHAKPAFGPIKDWPDRPPVGGSDAAFKAGRSVDDTLHNVTTNNQADVSDARQYIESMPKEYQTREFQEKAYSEIEHRMVDPKAEFSPDVKKFVEDTPFKEWYEKQKPLYDWIKAHKGGDELIEQDAPEDTASGYVHRIAQGKGSKYDSTDPGNKDVLAPGGRSLPRKAESENARKFFVLDDGKGNRTFVPSGKADGFELGKPHAGSDGKTYTLKHATSEEVEANTAVRYHKNAVVNTVDNVLKLQRVKRSLETLDAIKEEAFAHDLAYGGNRAYQAPKDYIYPNIPQLRDVKMHPALAASLNDFYGSLSDNSAGEAMAAVNRFLTRSIFFNPVPHLQNVGAFWTVARGSDWARPAAYGSLVRTGAKAIKEVVTQGPLVKQMLRDGSALQYPRTANQNFYKLMISRMGHEIERDPQTWKDVAENFGFSTPKDIVKQIYRTSQKAMWMGSDMMMVQRVIELQEKGMKLPEAIAEAEKWIPNYRVPSQVWNGPGGRAVSQLLQSPSGIMFGRYKYDQVKLIANLAHDLAKGSAAERKEALAKAIVLVGMATAVYPLADMALHKVTGRDDLRFRRAGPLTIPDAIYQYDQGAKDWVSTLSSVVTPAPVIQGLTEFETNKDVFGRDIVDPRASTLGKNVQRGEWAAGQIAPLGEAEEAMKPGGASKAAFRNIGISTKPKPTPGRVERRLRKDAGKREAKDPIEQMIRKAFQ